MIPIESPKNLKSKTLMGYASLAVGAMNTSSGGWPKVEVKSPKETSLVEIAVKTVDPKKGVIYLEHIKKLLIDDHRKIFTPFRETLLNTIKKVDIDISRIKKKNKELQKQLETVYMVYNDDADRNKKNLNIDFQAAILKQYIFNNTLSKERLELEKLNLNNKLNTLKETRIIKKPSYLKKQDSSKKKLVIDWGSVGLLASILLAFFMEFLEKYKLGRNPS